MGVWLFSTTGWRQRLMLHVVGIVLLHSQVTISPDGRFVAILGAETLSVYDYGLHRVPKDQR